MDEVKISPEEDYWGDAKFVAGREPTSVQYGWEFDPPIKVEANGVEDGLYFLMKVEAIVFSGDDSAGCLSLYGLPLTKGGKPRQGAHLRQIWNVREVQ
jgi:hypothetical protein